MTAAMAPVPHETGCDPPWRPRTACSLCGGRPLVRSLTLTPSPLADVFVDAAHRDQPQAAYPLELGRCEACGHVQLLAVVDRLRVFNFAREAHGSQHGNAQALRAFAASVLQRYPSGSNALIVDIGCNDGTFLKVFDEAGLRVQGVEAAANVAAQAVAAGLRVHAGLFTPAIADRIEEERGRAAYVVAHMALAETDAPAAFLEGVSLLLARTGIFVCEVVYLRDLIDSGAFDSINHRVLDYYALTPLVRFFAANDLEVVAVERSARHRGSIRVFSQRTGGPHTPDGSVPRMLAEEAAAGLNGVEPLARLALRTEQAKVEIVNRIRGLKATGARIAGYGAGVGATTLLHHLGLDGDTLAFIADDDPAKHGLFTPGLHIPVLAPESLTQACPDWVLVLAWNHAREIIERASDFRRKGGRFLVPLPRLAVV